MVILSSSSSRPIWNVLFIVVVIAEVISCSLVQVPSSMVQEVLQDRNTNVELRLQERQTDSPCVCGRGARKRIVSGNDATIDTFPWLAAVLWTTGDLLCGGAIINHFYILSASHCYVAGVNARDIMVVLGSDNIHDPTEDPYAVQKVIMHEKYGVKTRVDCDVALLRLSREIKFGESMQPICLTPPDENYLGLFGTVAGWGTTSFGGDQSNTLQEVNLPVIEDKYCMEKFEIHYTENMFCAGFLNGSKDACQGDSGGPIFIQDKHDIYFVFGVVSYGRGCALKTYPGVYTNLPNFIDWIQEKTKDVETCEPPTIEPTPTPTPTTESPTTSPPTCGVPNFSHSKRIVGGYDVPANQYPWTALVIKKENARKFTLQCGATLISNEWLITTARCVDSFSNSVEQLLVVLGENDVTKYEKTEVQVFVSEIWTHPNFNSNAAPTHNIALIRLSRPITFSREISPVCLPPDGWFNQTLAGIEGVATGWGWKSNTLPNPAVQQEVFLNISSPRECRKTYARAPEYVMCATSTRYYEGICYYDFGGQLSIYSSDEVYHLVGVSAFVSRSGCGRGQPSGFMRVSYYLPWIYEVTGIKFIKG